MSGEDSPQPAKEEQFRFFDCPFYKDCLRDAAINSVEAWSCGQCPNLRLQEIYQEIRFIAPYYRSLADIYPQFRARYERVMNSYEVEH